MLLRGTQDCHVATGCSSSLRLARQLLLRLLHMNAITDTAHGPLGPDSGSMYASMQDNNNRQLLDQNLRMYSCLCIGPVSSLSVSLAALLTSSHALILCNGILMGCNEVVTLCVCAISSQSNSTAFAKYMYDSMQHNSIKMSHEQDTCLKHQQQY